MSKLRPGKYLNKYKKVVTLRESDTESKLVDEQGSYYTEYGTCMFWKEQSERFFKVCDPFADLFVKDGEKYPVPLREDTEEQQLLDNGLNLASKASLLSKSLIESSGLDSTLIEKLRIVVRQLEVNNEAHNRLSK